MKQPARIAHKASNVVSLRAPTSGSWRPGVTPNPYGRAGRNPLIDAIRSTVDAGELVAIVIEIARTSRCQQTRFEAARFLADLAFPVRRPTEGTSR